MNHRRVVSASFHSIFLAAAALILAVPGAQARGVSNGAIEGVVIQSGGQPLPGVQVVAVREEFPPVTRSTATDAQGRFRLGDLYVGSYTLGFAKFGFRTITTQAGDPQNRTALGDQVRTFVEPGRTSFVGQVRLFPELGGRASQVTVVVSDASTGQPVEDANVIVGTSATSGPAPGGRYQLVVPPGVDAAGNLQPLRAIIQADGFARLETFVTAVPGANQNTFVRLTPSTALLTGRVQLGFGIPAEEITQVRVIVENVDPAFSSGRVVDQTGNFQVTVPASTSTRTRSFNLAFVLNNAMVARLTNVIAPRAGARTIPQPVPVQPRTVTVSGQVILSDGSVPFGTGRDAVVVLQLGRGFPVFNGQFLLSGIPIGRTFNLQAQVVNPRTGLVEIGLSQMTPIDVGAGGVFRLPPIVTRQAVSGFPTPF